MRGRGYSSTELESLCGEVFGGAEGWGVTERDHWSRQMDYSTKRIRFGCKLFREARTAKAGATKSFHAPRSSHFPIPASPPCKAIARYLCSIFLFFPLQGTMYISTIFPPPSDISSSPSHLVDIKNLYSLLPLPRQPRPSETTAAFSAGFSPPVSPRGKNVQPKPPPTPSNLAWFH